MGLVRPGIAVPAQDAKGPANGRLGYSYGIVGTPVAPATWREFLGQSDRFCAGCGTPRQAGARFCPGCGRPFDQSALGGAAVSLTVGPVTPAAPSGTTAQLAGIAWLGTAAVTAYLAFEQWSLANVLGSASGRELAGVAALNGISALITAYFGARSLQRPKRGALTGAVIWAALSVAFGVYQVSEGATYGVFLIVLVGTGVAGVLSYVARGEVPS
jgi:hypothetical protein